MATRYSEEFKSAIIDKILSPDTKSIRAVARDNDLPIATVVGWLRVKGIDMERINQHLNPVESDNPVYSGRNEHRI